MIILSVVENERILYSPTYTIWDAIDCGHIGRIHLNVEMQVVASLMTEKKNNGSQT